MSRRYKVKFEEDGQRCLNTINYLRKHPECGVRFIEDKPFNPVNPKPSPFPPKPKPHPRPSPSPIPDVPIIPIDPTEISQDTTNNFQTGRQLVGDYYYDNPYELVPANDNYAYSHEDIERERRLGEIEMEDFGAGVGIPNEAPRPIVQTRIRPIPDPRGVNVDELIERAERALQRGEELLRPRGTTNQEIELQRIQQLTRNTDVKEADLIEKQVKELTRKTTLPKRKKPVPEIEGTELVVIEPEKEEQLILREAERFIRKGRTTISKREALQIAEKFKDRGITEEKVFSILEEFKLYDKEFEEQLELIDDAFERSSVRRMRAQRLIAEETRRDTNLLPKRQEEIELREDTPLTRGRTDIAPGRTRFEKIVDRTAGQLPEELRGVYKSQKANLERFTENVRNNMLEAKQSLVYRTEEIFGRKYQVVPEIELTDNNIAIRPPITEERVVTEPLDFDPLGEDYGTFNIKPKLSYAERLKAVRTGGFDTTLTAGGAVGGVLLGGLAGAGLNKLLGNPDNIGIQSAVGGVGGAVGDVGARILTMAGTKALTRTAVETGAQTASASFIRGSTSLLRGAGEGFVVGAALTPVDILLNNFLVNRGASHVVANVSSGTLVGGLGVAGTTLGLAALGAAPETLGASLIIGGIAVAVSDIIGAIFGAKEDAERRKRQEELDKASAEDNTHNIARTDLLKSLPKYNYNFLNALDNFDNKKDLGIGTPGWNAFVSQANAIFTEKPTIIDKPTHQTNDPKDKKLNDIFNKFVLHGVISDLCAGKECIKQDPGKLTDDEYNYISKQTNNTFLWRAISQTMMIKEELKYKQIRIDKAKNQMLDAWKKDNKTPDQLDPYIVQTAYLDPSFKHQYELAIKLDAQQQVIDAYKKDQTKIDQLPKNIRQLAKQDPEFDTKIHQYYSVMEENAEKLNLSVPELVYLQQFKPEEQKDKYQELQFTDLQLDPKKVSEAQKLDAQQIKARDAGYYDIDQALLETDPTDITSWKPSDSQILQAHSAGMTLQEYTDYMHELSLGYSGDYERLPKYSKDQIRASGILDYSHFQDELQTAGYDKDLYLYNADTGTFTLNPNVRTNVIPNTQNQFIPRYMPSKLAKARQEYFNNLSGLNKDVQNQVDNYNANLSKELSSYGRHYAEIVSSVNDERLYEGRSDLLHFDAQKLYDQNKIEFKQEPTQEQEQQPSS